MKYKFIRDDDCHWYMIPVDQVDKFEEWVQYMEDMDKDYDGPDFDKYGCDDPTRYAFDKKALEEL